MLSGFLQLNCGISTFHWQRVIHLAWFSSVTHMCCLTFLRDHLCESKVLQVWRIPSMVILSMLLIYAFTTTSRYDWNDYVDYGASEASSHLAVEPYDQAVCFMRPPKISEDVATIMSGQRMIVSIVLLATGMISRVVRLYQPSHMAVIKSRSWVSRKAMLFLQWSYRKVIADSIYASVAAVLIYRPLLAVFLSARLLADVFTSKAFEVTMTCREI
jgi:hypothetical protein